MVYSSKKNQAGLTLIEVLVALGLSMFLIFGILTIFDSNKQSSSYQNALSRVQESGRIAVELMTRDIRMADYWGCQATSNDGSAVKTLTNNLNTGDSDYTGSLVPAMVAAFTAQVGLQAFDNVTGQVKGTITVKDGTDMITLTGARPDGYVKVVSPLMVLPSSDINIKIGAVIEEGDLLILTDCSGADLFTNTSTNTVTSGILKHDTSALSKTGAIDNGTADFSKIYKPDAQLLRPYSKTYFIGRQNATDNWSLWRQTMSGVPEEILRDVVDMQLIYGEDTDLDDAADIFVDGAGITDPERVISVKMEVEVENTEVVENGNNFTKTFVATANIRNRAR